MPACDGRELGYLSLLNQSLYHSSGPKHGFSTLSSADLILIQKWLAKAGTITSRKMNASAEYARMLAIAIAEARQGLSEGGVPVGAAIFHQDGRLVSTGHNRRVQSGDPSIHGETDAFRNAGRQRSYRDLIMVTTLAPCWYCSGLIRQFGFPTVLVGESRNFQGGLEWLRSFGVQVIDCDSEECVTLMADYIRAHPDVWNEDIGEEE